MTAGRSVEPFRRRAAWWFAWWVALMALWMVLVATTALAEVLACEQILTIRRSPAAGFPVVVLLRCNIVSCYARRARRLPRFELDSGAGRTYCANTRYRSTSKLMPEAPRGSRGRFVAVPFDVGPRSPRGTARRAVMAAAGSLAPNTYVLGFDRDEGVVLVHQLAPEDPEAVVRKLRGLT